MAARETVARLVIHAPAGTTSHVIRSTVTVIGRAAHCAVKISDECASREHCAIEKRPEGYILRDLNSRNGTMVNGGRVQEAKLGWGDRIQIGETQILFMLEEEEGQTVVRRIRTTRRERDDLTETITLRAQDLDPAVIVESQDLSEYMNALYGAATRLVTLRDESSVIRALHELVTRCFRVKNGCVLLMDARTGEVQDRYPDSARGVDIGAALEAMKEQEVVMNRRRSPPVTVSSMYAPLRGIAGVYGVIFVDNQGAEVEFTDYDLNALGLVGHQAGLQIENLRYLKRLEAEKRTLEQEVMGDWDLIGSPESVAMIEEFVRRVAPSDATVLIRGESGVGKELVARRIHAMSGRRAGPFVVVNCAAIPRDLVESELFGHEKGAFTGAAGMRRGHFEAAGGGSLLLDEIGELPLEMQAKLLRAIETKTFYRVGGHREVTADVRVIAATNRNLREEVAQGRFREDLYYRLNVVELVLAPLRERVRDIPVIAEHWIRRLNEKMGKRIEGLDEGAMQLLSRYPWPGNVRELKNVLERAVIFARGPKLTAEDFGSLQPTGEGGANSLSLETVEREHIRRVMRMTGGNKVEAARLLGINRSTLYEKLQRYGLA